MDHSSAQHPLKLAHFGWCGVRRDDTVGKLCSFSLYKPCTASTVDIYVLICQLFYCNNLIELSDP